jgi:Protein of unknown function (DUF3750).
MKKVLAFLVICFVLPVAASLGVRVAGSHPASWRAADWSSAGILPAADAERQAVIYVLAARTGGLKGAVSVHSWIVYKRAGEREYVRYDKVGWGSPVRRNSRPADGRWYSNEPIIVGAVTGDEAERLIPRLEEAIAAYPYSGPGGYRIWPGPNSNTFVATVLRQVPELRIVLPPEAIGKDYLPLSAPVAVSPDWLNLDVSLGGYAGFGIGRDVGLEIRLGGLIFGADFSRPALKVPGFGRIGMATYAQPAG